MIASYYNGGVPRVMSAPRVMFPLQAIDLLVDITL